MTRRTLNAIDELNVLLLLSCKDTFYFSQFQPSPGEAISNYLIGLQSCSYNWFYLSFISKNTLNECKFKFESQIFFQIICLYCKIVIHLQHHKHNYMVTMLLHVISLSVISMILVVSR